MNYTTRSHPRSMREAFPHDYQESAMGVEKPIETTPTPLEQLARVWGWLANKCAAAWHSIASWR